MAAAVSLDQGVDPRWPHLLAEASRRFGIASLRASQRELIAAVLAGRDAFGVLPTGGGKSLTYQLPALVLPKLVIVVSPLIALMKDQREHLAAAGVRVVEMDSTIDAAERRAGEHVLRTGAHCIVYVTPERLQSEECTTLLRARGVGLLAVDEAHCVSQWGHDFRPAYLRIAEAARRLGRPPILAVTATATPAVRTDIAAQLGLERPVVVQPTVARTNLSFFVHDVPASHLREEQICELLERSAGATIVYASTVKAADELHDGLVSRLRRGVTKYHAQLPGDVREENRRRFMDGRATVMVATKAFGMGIDKPDVRSIVHAHIPDSVESYVQEAGRAGRDGAPAEAHLLFLASDLRVQRYFLASKAPRRADLLAMIDALALGPDITSVATIVAATKMPRRKVEAVLVHLERLRAIAFDGKTIARSFTTRSAAEIERLLDGYAVRAAGDRARLDAMVRYAKTPECRSAQLLRYFGEDATPCGRCDVCRGGASWTG